jgi:predicted dehydrogenase
MSKHSSKSRRSFIKKALGTAVISSAAPSLFASPKKQVTLQSENFPAKKYSANDQVNIALIGAGIMGFNNLETSTKIPGVKLVGVCDLYTGRLDHAKEVYGKDIFTTKNYKEILDRKDVDAVIIATSDHWHDRISMDAMNKGKHVYCEKPMVHKLEEGADVIATQKKTGKVFQVGSQGVSSIVTDKARELFESGVIGQLILVETWNDRQGGNGAWQYSIPTDAKAGTVDWEAFLGDAPKVGYDPVRFFRWRNYQDYGTGMAGDLFVHLFSRLHAVTNSKGPNRIYSTGGLRYYKDGRDVPDIICGLYDYPATDKHPAFNLQMRVNFVSGDGGGSRLRLVGSDGVLTITGSSVKLERNKTSKNPGYGGWDSFNTFTEAQQKEYEQWYKANFPPENFEMNQPETEFTAPKGYSDNIAHHTSFYKGIRENAPIKEDALFSMRAAGPALASNKSVFEKKIVFWDPENAKLAAV